MRTISRLHMQGYSCSGTLALEIGKRRAVYVHGGAVSAVLGWRLSERSSIRAAPKHYAAHAASGRRNSERSSSTGRNINLAIHAISALHILPAEGLR